MSSITISEVEVRIYNKKDSKIKAFCDVVINEAIAIKNIKIIDGKNGLFLSMPSQKDSKGEFSDVVYPINKETRKLLQDTIMGEYNKGKKKTFKKEADDDKLFND